MTQICTHISVREIATTGFVGPVCHGADENRAAHGGVTVHEECHSCGRRRSRNVNQWHEEIGAWSESREERRALARKLDTDRRALVDARPEPRKCIRRDGLELVLSVDAEGYLCARGDNHHEHEAYAAWSTWPEAVAIAQSIRRATIAAREAAAAV